MMVLTTACVLAFIFSVYQSMMLFRMGTDHYVHNFLIRQIRQNYNRLFSKIPNLLNNSYCAALPIFLHWAIARVDIKNTRSIEILINPVFNCLHVVLLYLILWLESHEVQAPVAALLFAVTPQFYHSLSARNFGLSARGAGLLLLTLSFYFAFKSEQYWGFLVPLVLTNAVLIGTSTFGAQALTLASLILVLFGYSAAIFGLILGALFFIIISPSYALSYIKNTIKFIAAYRRELAPIYILDVRPSIWRDLIIDIWKRLIGSGVKKGLVYAYQNPVVVVCLLNPVAVLSGYLLISGGRNGSSIQEYAGALLVTSLILFLLTSFRGSRFLGEPERYVEALTPWAVVSLFSSNLYNREGSFEIIFCYCLIVVILQLSLSKLVSKNTRLYTDEFDTIRELIKKRNDDVRFCCNNEGVTKFFLENDWKFAYYVAVGQEYAGLSAKEIFSKFPFVTPKSVEKLVSYYKINYLLLDKTVFDVPAFDRPALLCAADTLYESSRFRLLYIS